MLDEVVTTIKAQLYDRAVSPLFGAFLLSWAGWNYRFIVVLFYSIPVGEKFDFIDKVLYANSWAFWTRGVVYPLLTALAIIFVYPWPAKWVYAFWRERQKELNEIRKKIEDESPLTREEERELRQSIRRERDEFEQQYARLEEENRRLKQDAYGRLNPPPREMSPAEKLYPTQPGADLKKDERDMLNLLYEAGGEIPKESARSTNISGRQDIVQRDFVLASLMEKQYIQQGVVRGDRGPVEGYMLTQRGRAAALGFGKQSAQGSGNKD